MGAIWESAPSLAPDLGNASTIREIYPMIMGEDPGAVEYRAAEWSKTAKMLNNLRDQLTEQAEALMEDWTGSARDAFEERISQARGYMLGLRIKATTIKIGLEGLAGVMDEYRAHMSELYEQYEEEYNAAREASKNAPLGDVVLRFFEMPEMPDRVDEKYGKYARNLAGKMANAYQVHIAQMRVNFPDYEPLDSVFHPNTMGVDMDPAAGGGMGLPPGAPNVIGDGASGNISSPPGEPAGMPGTQNMPAPDPAAQQVPRLPAAGVAPITTMSPPAPSGSPQATGAMTGPPQALGTRSPLGTNPGTPHVYGMSPPPGLPQTSGLNTSGLPGQNIGAPLGTITSPGASNPGVPPRMGMPPGMQQLGRQQQQQGRDNDPNNPAQETRSSHIPPGASTNRSSTEQNTGSSGPGWAGIPPAQQAAFRSPASKTAPVLEARRDQVRPGARSEEPTTASATAPGGATSPVLRNVNAFKVRRTSSEEITESRRLTRELRKRIEQRRQQRSPFGTGLAQAGAPVLYAGPAPADEDTMEATVPAALRGSAATPVTPDRGALPVPQADRAHRTTTTPVSSQQAQTDSEEPTQVESVWETNTPGGPVVANHQTRVYDSDRSTAISPSETHPQQRPEHQRQQR